MSENNLRKFNFLCAWLERYGLLHPFYHALHETVFPGKTRRGEYNMIWAIQCSHPEDWHDAAQMIDGRTFPDAPCGLSCPVESQVTSRRFVDEIQRRNPYATN